MPTLTAGGALVVSAFLIGAVPWGYVVAKTASGIDLRSVGSGGTGATNVLRTLGLKASALVFVLDFLKGVVPVLLARTFGFGPDWEAAAAVAAVAGHCWSPFIAFKGGKGVATGAGATVMMFPSVLVVVPIAVAVVWATKYVSLASLVSAVAAALLATGSAATGRLDWPRAIAILAIAVIIVIRHESNIRRLINGTERRIGETVALS